MRLNATSFALPVVMLLCLSACDLDPLGLSEKKIGGGYRLLLAEDGGFAVLRKGDGAGQGVTRLGWRKPFIVAVTGDGYWEVFDTSTGSDNLSLSAEQVQADVRVRDIPLVPAETAWKRLRHYRSQW